MITYDKLAANEKLFFRFTGTSTRAFENLHAGVSEKYEKYEAKRLYKKDRKIKQGSGRKFRHNLKDRLVIFLLYYRMYLTQELLMFIYGLDKSNISRNIKYLEPLVRSCLPIPQKISRKKIGTMDELLARYPELKAFVDATEQEIQRPKHKKRRDNHYSGKKKRHTRKTQIVVNKKGLITHKSRSTNGKRHDKKLFEQQKPSVPPKVSLGGDLGYAGIKNLVKNKVTLPIKKPKGGKLSKKDKRYNRKFSKERVIVENTIKRMKDFKLMGQKYRNKLKDYDLKTDIISGLVNIRIMEL